MKIKKLKWETGKYGICRGKINDHTLFTYEWSSVSNSPDNCYILHNTLPGYKIRIGCSCQDTCKLKAQDILNHFVNSLIDKEE